MAYPRRDQRHSSMPPQLGRSPSPPSSGPRPSELFSSYDAVSPALRSARAAQGSFRNTGPSDSPLPRRISRKMFRVLGSAAVLLLCAGVLAGCGGSDHKVAEYRTKVNAICLALYRTSIPNGRGRAARLSAIVKAEGAAVASMRALNPPASLASLHRRAVAVADAGLVRISKLAKEYKAGTITWPQLAARKWGPLISEETRLWDQAWRRCLCPRPRLGSRFLRSKGPPRQPPRVQRSLRNTGPGECAAALGRSAAGNESLMVGG